MTHRCEQHSGHRLQCLVPGTAVLVPPNHLVASLGALFLAGVPGPGSCLCRILCTTLAFE